jgi:Predicted glycosyltransferases
MDLDVAVLIVSYNSAAHLGDCLESVFAHSQRVRLEVIVVDNASTDDSAEFVRSRFPSVRLITPGRNLGFAAGVNLAARHATADYLLLLNPDTVLLDHAIDAIVEFARSSPGHGLYGARTFKPDGRVEPSSCWGLPTLWSLTMFATGLSSVARQHPLFDPESLGDWPRDTVREVGMISGCCLLIARSVWNKLGGFDERFFMYGEDADLSMRARQSGYRPILCPRACLIHEVGQSSTPAGKLLLLFRGKATLLHTHWRGLRRVAGLALLLAGVAVRALGTQFVRALRRQSDPGRWLVVWRRRREWIQGYGARAPALSLPTPGNAVAQG